MTTYTASVRRTEAVSFDPARWLQNKAAVNTSAFTAALLDYTAMNFTFKNLDEFDEITGDLTKRYNALTLQLAGRECEDVEAALEDVKQHAASELLLFMFDGNGEVCATAQVSYHRLPLKGVGYINGVVVDEKYRGHGLGTVLMQELERRAKDRWSKLAAFNLTSSPKKGTQGFYLRLGYRMRTKEAGDETIFYVKNID